MFPYKNRFFPPCELIIKQNIWLNDDFFFFGYLRIEFSDLFIMYENPQNMSLKKYLNSLASMLSFFFELTFSFFLEVTFSFFFESTFQTYCYTKSLETCNDIKSIQTWKTIKLAFKKIEIS